MRTHGAILIGALIALLAAKPAHSQQNSGDVSETLNREVGPFLIEATLDAGLVAAAGDNLSEHEALFGDLDFAATAEAITDSGVRWGARIRLRAQADNGREGFAARTGSCVATTPGSDCHGSVPPQRSLATGRYHSVFAPAEDRLAAALEAAHLFVRPGWGEIRLGLTPGAALLDQPLAPSASRLVTAGGGALDPTGLEASLTRNSASSFGPKLLIQSERILGLSLALSFAGQSQGCGVDMCVHETQGATLPGGAPARLHGNTLNQVWEAGLTFDHRFARAGHIELGASLLTGEVDRDPAGDPYTAWSLAARWSQGDWSLGAAWLNAGQDDDRAYTAMSMGVSRDFGLWRVAGEAAWSSDNFIHEESRLWQIGASRLVGETLLIGGGVRMVSAQRAAQAAGARIVDPVEATSVFVELGVRY